MDELSDVDRARLNSCIDEVITTLEGPNITRKELAELVLKNKYDVEAVINAILEDSKFQKPSGLLRDKGEYFCCRMIAYFNIFSISCLCLNWLSWKVR